MTLSSAHRQETLGNGIAGLCHGRSRQQLYRRPGHHLAARKPGLCGPACRGSVASDFGVAWPCRVGPFVVPRPAPHKFALPAGLSLLRQFVRNRELVRRICSNCARPAPANWRAPGRPAASPGGLHDQIRWPLADCLAFHFVVGHALVLLERVDGKLVRPDLRLQFGNCSSLCVRSYSGQSLSGWAFRSLIRVLCSAFMPCMDFKASVASSVRVSMTVSYLLMKNFGHLMLILFRLLYCNDPGQAGQLVQLVVGHAWQSAEWRGAGWNVRVLVIWQRAIVHGLQELVIARFRRRPSPSKGGIVGRMGVAPRVRAVICYFSGLAIGRSALAVASVRGMSVICRSFRLRRVDLNQLD